MSERKVPVAYVTKYAETRGILVVRNARTSDDGRYLVKRPMFLNPNEWTEDKDLAEDRYTLALRRALKSAEDKASRVRDALAAAPKYEEEAP